MPIQPVFPGGSATASSDMELLFSTTLTSAANSVTTGTLPTGYKSYLIIQRSRSDRANSDLGFNRIYFNNDLTDTNYQILRLDNMGVASGFRTLNRNQPGTALSPSAGGDANFYGSAEIRVLRPESTTGYKSFQIYNGMHSSASDTSLPTSDRLTIVTSGVWRDTAAITSITFKEVSTEADGSAADFEVGSSFEVYGLK